MGLTQLITDSVCVDTAAQPQHCVVWLHGLGADGHDFEPIVPELAIPESHAVRFIFPHAPVRPVTINGGMQMRAWYDFLTLAPVRGEHYGQVQESVIALQQTITALRQEYSKVVIGGFSQGGVIAGTAALSEGAAPDGVFVLSAYLPDFHRAGLTLSAEAADLPVFQAHGVHDPVIPVTFGRAARETFDEAGTALEYEEYMMEHNVCLEEIRALRTWLLKVLAA